jgi:hypothetical protein
MTTNFPPSSLPKPNNQITKPNKRINIFFAILFACGELYSWQVLLTTSDVDAKNSATIAAVVLFILMLRAIVGFFTFSSRHHC